MIDIRAEEIRRAIDEWYEEFGELPRARLAQHGDHGDADREVLPLYSGANVDIDEMRDLGVPGTMPFVRGAYPTGYRKRPWQMVQYVGFGTTEETNERWRTLIAAGQRAVSLAFDLPSHLGFDSDHPLAEDEIGKAGTAIDSLEDFERLFEGIDLGATPATFNTAAIAPIVVAMYQVVAEQQGVPLGQLAGTITNDPLSSAYRGTVVLPAGPSVRLVVDVIEYCARTLPKFTPVNVQGVYMRSVGATKAQEAAFAFCNALAYLGGAVARGIRVEDIAPRFSFFFQCDSHVFEEAAKFRAARRVWADCVSTRFGTQDPNSLRLRATGVSTARTFTKEEPEINLVRGAYSALGCALGGVQGMWISGFDEAFATPTAKASRLALRTMQILAEETGVTDTIDPLGGGYFIEHLTGQMAEMMRDEIDAVDAQGGAVAATEQGFQRRRMMDNDTRWHRERERGDRHIVAHNIYRQADGDAAVAPVEFQRFRPDVGTDQLRRLNELRSRRDSNAVERGLKAIATAAAGTTNVMPAVVEAVRAYATVGEIMDVFRAQFGEWTEPAL